MCGVLLARGSCAQTGPLVRRQSGKGRAVSRLRDPRLIRAASSTRSYKVLIHGGLARFPALLQWCTHQTPLSKLELLAGSLFSQTLRAWWGRVNKPNVARTRQRVEHSGKAAKRTAASHRTSEPLPARGRQRVCGSAAGRSRATNMIVSRKLALRQAHSINEMVPIYRRLLPSLQVAQRQRARWIATPRATR